MIACLTPLQSLNRMCVFKCSTSSEQQRNTKILVVSFLGLLWLACVCAYVRSFCARSSSVCLSPITTAAPTQLTLKGMHS
ncbi:unnamed protein product [Ceratitis capitata]|uniref:(Mediterranean fruit fly) hypothetical protein n=1 Tax=Ceratitis capitata TaxID=7213 RepID=A0A811UKG5_CERCA|nr:unnamed protein product [Ceratitis capitata]